MTQSSRMTSHSPRDWCWRRVRWCFRRNRDRKRQSRRRSSPLKTRLTTITPDKDNPDIDRALDEVILAAVQAALPPDVLAALRAASMRSRGRSQGKAGALQKSGKRGRPAGVLRGELRAGAKLNVIETLRAAAPWQPLRRREEAAVWRDVRGRAF